MKKLALSAAAILALATQLSAQGINFEQGDWKSVVAKATKEHKLIYMDVYTTWCGPCKKLAAEIFPQKAAGDKYNPLFVNYRMDAEKGEGIAIAAKYAVHGYPTHLFINPANEALVYQGMGYSPDVSEFTGEADKAMAEYKDPITWEKYTSKFKGGTKDTAFLIAYLNKAHRLNKDAAAGSIMNAYITALGSTIPTDQQLRFIDEMMPGINNAAVAYLGTYKERLQALHSDGPDYYHSELIQWIYKTFEQAVDTKNEALLPVLADGIKQYTPERDADIYSFRTDYYTKTGNKEKAAVAAAEEADYLMARPQEKYDRETADFVKAITASIHEQLVEAKVPADKMDELMKLNLDRTMAQASPAMQTAAKLNSAAWAVYEQQGTNATAVARALPWSKKSLDLAGESNDSWTAFADTYAHLLFVSGKKEDAIALEQKAADKLKTAGSTDAASYQEAVDKMKTGKL